jgi:hypothetical protein
MQRIYARRGPMLAWTTFGASTALLLLVGSLRLAIATWPLTLVVIVCIALIGSMAFAVILHRSLMDSRAEVLEVHGRRRFWAALICANGSTALDFVSLLLALTAL